MSAKSIWSCTRWSLPTRPSSVCFRAGTMLSTFCQRWHHGPALGDLENPRKKMDIWVKGSLTILSGSNPKSSLGEIHCLVASNHSLRFNPNSVDQCPRFCLFVIAKLQLTNPHVSPSFSQLSPLFYHFSKCFPHFAHVFPCLPPPSPRFLIGTCSLKALSVSQVWGLDPFAKIKPVIKRYHWEIPLTLW